jgi:predicted acetyltransferase
MNELELVFPTKAHEIDAKEYSEEHIQSGENTLHGDRCLESADSYDEWLERINDALTLDIHSIVFFAIRRRDKKLIGTINVRYPYLGYVQVHGHIGYGIRPSERRKGYATMMLKLALEHCKKIGLEKVLLTCDKSNLASAKTIMKCSGVFENEEKQNDGDYLQRYWIEL